MQLPPMMEMGWLLTEWISEFDLRQSDWKKQAIVWYKNGKEFHRVTGATVNSQAVWKTLAAQPLYIIFNVAVGGDFVSALLTNHHLLSYMLTATQQPGPPNSQTIGGKTQVLELGYVAHYVSN